MNYKIIEQHINDIKSILKDKELTEKQVFRICNILEQTAEKIFCEVEK